MSAKINSFFRNKPRPLKIKLFNSIFKIFPQKKVLAAGNRKKNYRKFSIQNLLCGLYLQELFCLEQTRNDTTILYLRKTYILGRP